MKSELKVNKEDEFIASGAKMFAASSIIFTIILVIATIIVLTGEAKLGEVGSYLSGAIGPMAAILVAGVTFLAFHAQYVANINIQKQFKVQQFESRFYKMLDIHNRNVELFEISNYERRDSGKNRLRGQITGKRVFLSMVSEFHSALDTVYRVYGKKFQIQSQPLNELGYSIFFYGIKSEHLKKADDGDKEFDRLKTKIVKFQDDFRSTHGNRRTIYFDKGPPNERRQYGKEVRTSYVPFCGHESRLAQYYRHLYQTAKQIKNAEAEGTISYQNAREYFSMLRAQLSNEEQILLYYNYICSKAGKAWDKKGGKKHGFLTKYRLIHNLPFKDNRLSEAIEDPRSHFKDFINHFCDQSDTLFEWGDKFESNKPQ